MPFTSPLVPAFADNFAVPHKDTADQWIWGDRVTTALSQRERPPHPPLVTTENVLDDHASAPPHPGRSVGAWIWSNARRGGTLYRASPAVRLLPSGL
jgi:hypothetical protein